jgi:hypothetical protein
MFKNGWLRLWIVLTGVLLVGVAVVSANYIWGTDPCYSFVTVSIAENVRPQDRELADHVKHEATTKTFCGKSEYSALLTLEDLASRGAVTQVGFQWLEPSGWSFKNSAFLGVLDGKEIKASEIIGNASTYVYQSRFFEILWLIVAALLVSPFVLALGFGIAWVRKGFKK